jgi:UDP-N-acetylmuramoyl-tripeptide--D-alanyl-D-alanine ligase
VREHEAIGTLALEMGIDHLVAIGAPEYGALLKSDGATSIHICADKGEAEHFIDYLNRGDVVLCKGSRSAGLEEIAAKIEESWMSRIEEQA